MPKRTKIPDDVITEVLTACLRRCCLCFALRRDDAETKGQIAHLDHDPSNAALANLAYLCFEHHDQYDSKTSQSKGLTIDEVKQHRGALLTHLAARRTAIDAPPGVGRSMPAVDPLEEWRALSPSERDVLLHLLDTDNGGDRTSVLTSPAARGHGIWCSGTSRSET